MDGKSCCNKNSISQLTANALLDKTFHPICHIKKGACFNNDIWFVRRDWQALRSQLRTHLLAGRYLFSSSKTIKVEGPTAVWSSLNRLSERRSVKYLRYRDNIIIFCKTRWILRKIIKDVHRILVKLRLTIAKSKTYIGKITEGFHFLGYHFEGDSSDSVTVSKTSIQCFYRRMQRLYEQRATVDRVAAYKRLVSVGDKWVRSY